jgi:hypothetical protein
VPLEDFTLSPLTSDFDVSNFDCGNTDINEFLIEDALNFQSQNLSNTFVFYKDFAILLYFK